MLVPYEGDVDEGDPTGLTEVAYLALTQALADLGYDIDEGPVAQ